MLVDDAHSGNVDTELIIAASFCRINSMNNFKLVVMSATLDVASFYRQAMDAGVNRNAVDHLIMEEIMKPVETFVLQPTESPRDNLEMAVRAVIHIHNDHPIQYEGTKNGTFLIFVSGKCLSLIFTGWISDAPA